MPSHNSARPALNAVKALRLSELANSQRAFVARGSRVSRCDDCLLASRLCICNERPEARGGVAVCLVYYKGEVFKPSNTGRLIADVVMDTHAFLWQRTSPHPGMLALLRNPDYAPVVVFPYEYAEPERHLRDDQALEQYIGNRTPLLIFLDGTWREARKMFRSDWLNELPVIAVEPEQASQYLLREAVHEHQLGTAEVAIPLLQRLQQAEIANNLDTWFLHFRSRYLAGKANHYPSSAQPDPDN